MSTGYLEPCAKENTWFGAINETPKCMNKAINVEKVCRPGYTLASDGWCKQPGNENEGHMPSCPPGSAETTNSKCAKLEPIVCPANQTFHFIYTSQFEGNLICVPNSVVLRPSNFDPSNPRNFPCASNEFFSNTTNQCIPPASSPASSSSAVNDMNLPEIEATYQKQLQDYETAITTALANKDASKLPEIRSKAEAIQATLNKMIEELTYLKKETPNIRMQRDNLIATLRRIQKDYNAMLVNTDDLETLRRIREQESGEAKRELFMYIGFFLVLAIVILLFLIFMSPSQKKDMATSSPNTPAMSPALT